jgi:predicted enzyme related to lactoylglutathione lyase
MPSIVRFEIHATQPQVLIDFYSKIFGWTFTKVESVGFWRIETTDGSKGGLNGGLVKRPGSAPDDTPAVNAFICTVQVDALDATVANAISHGAVIALPKMSIPGTGLLAYIKDPDGNVLGLLQPAAPAEQGAEGPALVAHS